MTMKDLCLETMCDLGGAKYKGCQGRMVLFSARNGTQFALPISQISAEAVRERVKASEESC